LRFGVKSIFSPLSYGINFHYEKENDEYYISSKNLPYITAENFSPSKPCGILGPNFWDPKTREINLSKDGLRLTVTKAVIKGKSDISVEKMKEIRKIPKDTEINYSKVSLGFKTPDSHLMISPIYIIDKAKYDFEICDMTRLPSFCQNGLCVITVDFEKANLTNDYNVTLSIETLTGIFCFLLY